MSYWKEEILMRLDYQQTYKEEILVEFASSVYAQVVNLVVEHKLNIHDENHFLVHLMHQLGDAKLAITDAHSWEELETTQEYWQTMNEYVKRLCLM